MPGRIERFLLTWKTDEVFGRRLPCCCIIGFLLAVSLCVPAALAQLSTEDHLAEPGFWPTQDIFFARQLCGIRRLRALSWRQSRHAEGDPYGTRRDVRFALGHSACPSVDESLPRANISIGSRAERVRAATRSVTGNQTLSFPLLWAFGTGRVGQSYCLQETEMQIFSKPGSPTSKPSEQSTSRHRARCCLPPALKKLWTVPFPRRR